jgi:hypothetical protein
VVWVEGRGAAIRAAAQDDFRGRRPDVSDTLSRKPEPRFAADVRRRACGPDWQRNMMSISAMTLSGEFKLNIRIVRSIHIRLFSAAIPKQLPERRDQNMLDAGTQVLVVRSAPARQQAPTQPIIATA